MEAKAAVRLGLVGSDVDKGREVEEADRPIGEATGQVTVRQGEATADEALRTGHLRRVKMEGRVDVAPDAEVPRGPVVVHVLVPPGGTG